MGGAVVGATVADDGEQDSEAPLVPTGAEGGEDRLYQVVGTLRDPQSIKPAWVTEIIQVLGAALYIIIAFVPKLSA